ncbi:hypothetical protein ACIQW5_24615 [Methylorubrum thiocyanatum]|uniref:hypothetical protein n=1 Tax=Methylorubrum thiocyanatum TaxID=47958 RepID=UPI00383A31E8
MARRSSLGAFSLPSSRGCLSPSALVDRLNGHARASAFLASAVLTSLMGTMWLTYLCVKRAEVIPYVADGGVFGCEVRTLSRSLPLPDAAQAGKTEP